MISLDQFLRRWVGGKYKADRVKLFRDFLRNEVADLHQKTGRRDSDPDEVAARNIEFRNSEGFSQDEFDGTGSKLAQWIEAERKRKRTEKARNAALARHRSRSHNGPS